MIITLKVVREIGVIFNSSINGPYIKYSEYPKEEFETLFARFKEAQFSYICTEHELKDVIELHVKIRFSSWMSELRRGIFKKYPTVGERYAHAPENVPPRIWRQMVDKWMDEGWKKTSTINKRNRTKSKLIHTTSSIPMAKHRKEMQQIGIELSPLDLFKMFHVRKNGIWASNKAKEMHEIVESMRSTVIGRGVGR
ncbi:uncharacterized protein LOC102629497 [Citrus sinensis]|uniref:uncharacterized protein LOC18044909 n=1 Tax=Citrus clementina TaxID=85681 RepID=UPI000CED6D6F|nr:uncharacterized protein LOC18044909 [Citrus x clementina]XP_052287574.1 uncharacterized protein LOC102629497 [Citrus sinensis]